MFVCVSASARTDALGQNIDFASVTLGGEDDDGETADELGARSALWADWAGSEVREPPTGESRYINNAFEDQHLMKQLSQLWKMNLHKIDGNGS